MFIFLKKLLNRVLELVGKKEQPKDSIVSEEEKVVDVIEKEKPSAPPQEVLLRLKELEVKYSSKMNIKKDIIAYCYICERGESVRSVAAIFNVAPSTISRRAKELPMKFMVIFKTIKEEFSLSDNEILEILKEHYGPEFSLSEDGTEILISVD